MNLLFALLVLFCVFVSQVGERGCRLSGGQKQRVALARGLFGQFAVSRCENQWGSSCINSHSRLRQSDAGGSSRAEANCSQNDYSASLLLRALYFLSFLALSCLPCSFRSSALFPFLIFSTLRISHCLVSHYLPTF